MVIDEMIQTSTHGTELTAPISSTIVNSGHEEDMQSTVNDQLTLVDLLASATQNLNEF